MVLQTNSVIPVYWWYATDYSSFLPCVTNFGASIFKSPFLLTKFTDEGVSRAGGNSLTDECMVELNKLDHAGVLLDPRMFKDKGVYLNPQPIGLSINLWYKISILSLNSLAVCSYEECACANIL